MMPVTIDPSETRRPAGPAALPPRSRLRLVLLSGLGVLGLAGFTALASSMLGSLAGPQFVRPTIHTAALAQKASEWPDLRNGVPALAPAAPSAERSPPSSSSVIPDAPALIQAAMPDRTPVPVVASSSVATQPSKPAEPAIEAKPVLETRSVPEAKPVIDTKVVSETKPRLPPIENASVLPPARPASLVPASRTAALIAPSPTETTRSRATNGTFTALPPEREAAGKRKPVATVEVKPVSDRPVAAKPAPAMPAPAKQSSAKAVPAKVASAAIAPAASEPESEQTEVFGIKVPSLAPAGRKLAEGVEAFGNAVKSLPDRF